MLKQHFGRNTKNTFNLRCDLNPGLPYTITTPREEERVQITQQVKVSEEEEESKRQISYQLKIPRGG